MLKRKKTLETAYVDDAKERLMMNAFIDKLKDIVLFIFVAVILTWLVLGIM